MSTQNNVTERKNATRQKKGELRRKRLIHKFFSIVISIVLVFIFGASIFAVVYRNSQSKTPVDKSLDKGQVTQPNIPDTSQTQTPKQEKKEQEEKKQEEEPLVNTKTNVAVFGVDKEEIHTDVIFVASFDAQTKQISILSVPRDTKVVMTKDMISSLRKRNKYIPQRDGVLGQCKLTEVHAYAGTDYANEFSVMQLENLLGIDIDYYVRVNIQGFRDIVDAIGGVEMNVPVNMNYDDPEQGLSIHLKAGVQVLDGDKAEQLVRFREGYAQKDLKRIEVQQEFMKAFMKKILSTDTLINNLPSLIYTAFKYVDTDFGVGDALKYVKYIKDISMDNIVTETVPGEGGIYFTIDKKGTQELVDRMFYSKGEENTNTKDSSSSTIVSSKELKIEVANGGITQGLAAKKRDMLEEEGFHVEFISTYNGTQVQQTRIIVKQKGEGEDLIPYFTNSEIVVDPTLISNGTDIKIILGLEEK